MIREVPHPTRLAENMKTVPHSGVRCSCPQILPPYRRGILLLWIVEVQEILQMFNNVSLAVLLETVLLE